MDATPDAALYSESVHEAKAPPARSARASPTDAVTLGHVWIDGELMAWGRWTRARMGSVKCGSAEGQYRSPWRQWHYPSIEELMPKPLDGWIWKLDRAVTATLAYRAVLTMHYARLLNPYVTCRKLRMRYEHFAPVMNDARAAVLKILRTE